MQEVTPFYPIHLDSLVSDSTLEFNLCIKTAGEKCILFRERSLEFGERHRRKARMLPVSLHHEKLNGKRYPRGLVQEQIHLHGRIAAIADCFDVMTTNRSYQSAMDGFEVLQIMKTKL